MTRYAHAKPGQRCIKCNDYAVRLICGEPHCLVHFDALVGTITKRVRWRMLTPPDDPASNDAWRDMLQHGINIGVIDEHEAAEAWRRRRKEAA